MTPKSKAELNCLDHIFLMVVIVWNGIFNFFVCRQTISYCQEMEENYLIFGSSVTAFFNFRHVLLPQFKRHCFNVTVFELLWQSALQKYGLRHKLGSRFGYYWPSCSTYLILLDPILGRKSTVLLLLLLLLLCMSRSGDPPPWILKRGGVVSSGRRLISSIGKTKQIAYFFFL